MKTILKFYSPTCGPCKAMSRNLEEIKDIPVLDIDITNIENQDYLKDYNIRTVPTVIVIGDNREVLGEFKGVVPIDKIKEVL